MNPKDKKRFAQAFGTLCTVFNKELSPVLNKAYFAVLERFDIDDVEAAISESISNKRFFPKPVELKELITGGQPQIEDTALVEANQVIAHLQRHGAHVSPVLEDPITKYLMTRRWPYRKWASQMLDAELKWWEKEFCDAYRAHSAKDHAPEIDGPPRLRLLARAVGKEIN